MYFKYSLAAIKASDVNDIVDRIYYLSPKIISVVINDEYITIEHNGELGEKVLKQIESLLFEKERKIKKKKLHDNRTSDDMEGDFQRLSEEELILKGEPLILYEAIKKIFHSLSEKYHAQHSKYPVFMSKKLMERSKYASHFPQNIYRVAEIEHKEETLEKYRKFIESNKDTSDLFMVNDSFLRPCLCYFTYEERKDRQLKQDLEVFSSSGQCFRHEHDRRISPYRTRDFNMHEIVYLGTQERVESIRQHLVSDVWDLFNDLGLKGYIESANDPFFIKADQRKIAYQRAADMKYELIFSPNKNTNFSVCSFNLCGDVLTESFGINDCHNEKAYSGCTAFGLERWVQAIIYTHGLNPKVWPPLIREMIRYDG